MKKRFGAVFLAGVFLFGMLFGAGAATNDGSSKGSWLYVGGSSPGNYSSIQAAIDNATEGDTIYVYDDSSPYHEKLNVTKPLQIIGEDKETTVIDAKDTYFGDGYVIHLLSEHATISNFTIKNSDFGVHLYFLGNETVTNNIFTDIEYPIYIHESSNNTVCNNTIVKTTDVRGDFIGIYMYHADDNLIAGNLIRDENWILQDMAIHLAYCFRNVVKDNTMFNCSIDAWEDTFASNTFIRNFNNGKPIVCLKDTANLVVDYADKVVLTGCSNILISSINFSRQQCGVIIYNCRDCKVTRCTFTGSSQGIQVTASDHINITQNTFQTGVHNSLLTEYRVGLGLTGVTNSIVIANVFIDNNVGAIIRDSNTTQVTHNLFRNNRGLLKMLLKDAGGAVVLDSSSDINITSNNFYHNLPDAYFAFCGHNTWQHNYWGRPWILPRPILGITYGGPWYPPQPTLAFDLRPALLPQKTTVCQY